MWIRHQGNLMNIMAVAVLTLVAITVLLFVTEKLPIDLVALLVMTVLLLSGIVTPSEGLAGFSNSATITIGALFVVSAGLYKTGTVNFVGRFIARIGRRSFWLALIVLMLTVGLLSAFVNHTAIVAIFIPIVIGIAHDIKVSPSKLLMPLSFASMFGGVCTLIGSSTNLLVNSLAERFGEKPFGMFEFAHLGLILFGAGVIYLLVIGVRLIPEREAEDLRKTIVQGDYLAEIVILPEAEFIGKNLYETPLVQDLDFESQEIYRGKTRLPISPAGVVLQEGDMLRVRCSVDEISKLQELKGVAFKSELAQQLPEEEKEKNLMVEAVVAPNSILVGKSLKQMRFRSFFGANAHAIRHRGTIMRDNVETTTLYPGDVLLIEVNQERLDYLLERNAFVVVSEVELPTYRKSKMLSAVAIVSAVVASTALGVVPVVVGTIAGAIMLVLTECLTLNDAYDAIEWKVIFMIASVLTLGKALEKTGAAAMIANLIVETVGVWGPTALVSAFYLMTSIFTELMSNKATAVLLVPIAIATAHSLKVDARPLLMAVTFAGSVTFMTPVGHQVNTLIYGPGRFKYADFLRVGTPLNILFWLLATLLIPRFWHF
jgi:di/tricarboxylate transporter